MTRVARRVRSLAGGGRAVTLIDGGSGAGKSTFATSLAAELGSQLVRLDDVYPGWDGLEAGSRAVYEEIVPLAHWHRWDWDESRAGDIHRIDPVRDVVIEGCGALSHPGRAVATAGIWIELDERERHRRAIARDGAVYEAEWDRWAAQEAVFFTRERPDLLADIRLDGRVLPIPGLRELSGPTASR
ncbi:ATP-binding protein [Amnibacterium flavum]|uniref:ATP-binding protein n=1 Tax=Amnibacterium flavum TaxID=2173173 RepID=UPI0010577450|nr:ATP-binding protein [Amnibacterium flavum]